MMEKNNIKVVFEGEKFFKLSERPDIPYFMLVHNNSLNDEIWFQGRMFDQTIEKGTVTNRDGVLVLNIADGRTTYLSGDSLIVPVEIKQITVRKIP